MIAVSGICFNTHPDLALITWIVTEILSHIVPAIPMMVQRTFGQRKLNFAEHFPKMFANDMKVQKSLQVNK